MANKANVANPHEKGFGTSLYLFQFSAGYGVVNVIAYEYDPGEALEAAAKWLVEQELFGLITPHDRPQEDLGCDCADPFECDSHLYTEAGWLNSDELYLDEPSNEGLRQRFSDSRGA